MLRALNSAQTIDSATFTHCITISRRRLTSRTNELTEQYEAEHSRVLSLERTKTQLTGQIHEIQIQLDSVSHSKRWLQSRDMNI